MLVALADDGLTALSMPRFSAIGFAPAATVLTPSRIDRLGQNGRGRGAVAGNVAEVFDATSRTICAPMFSSASLSSISLATVTPSLVMVGEPNFFSITTLRPFGSKGYLDRVGEDVYPAQDRLPRIFSVQNLLRHRANFLYLFLSQVPSHVLSRVSATTSQRPFDLLRPEGRVEPARRNYFLMNA